ncbi:hypothetical protein BKA62DRAFT_832550 [Auriculariales sp. MPI-PUGE-AT-0066]|nr:hypothetical protein BKA62DRAFT_832550 [Auriculariales sp. MPI-PUGE-AT-0066]
MFIARLILALASIGVVVATPSLSKRDHTVTVVNNCGRTITPVYHDPGNSFNMTALGPGQSTATTVGEAQTAWRIWGEDGKGCGWPDGGGCTLLECSFDNPNFRQCNLSRVDGFNVGVTFTFNDASCGGNNCLDANCPPDHAFSTPDNGGASIRQCNVGSVSMTVTFSC